MSNKVAIDSIEMITYSGKRTPAYVGALPSASFTNIDGQFVGGGRIQSVDKDWIVKVAVHKTGDLYYSDPFDGDRALSATRWGEYDQPVRWNFYLLDAKLRIIKTLYANIVISDLLQTTTIADAEKLSKARNFNRTINYVSRAELQRELSALDLAPDATTLVKGKVLLSTTGTNVAVSDNDPRLEGDSLASLYGNSLFDALAAIGSIKTTLVVDTDATVSSALVVPSTLKLNFVNGARLVRNSGGSINFAGNPFADGQEMSKTALFEGFSISQITFSGDVPADISSEIAYHATNSVSERLKLLTSWFASRKTTFHCMPRPITASVELSDYHSLYFRKGVFTNSYAGGGIVGTPPFVLGSESSFSSELGARIYSSSVNNSPQIVHTKINCQNSVIENNYFTDGGGGFDGASFGVAITQGSFNCHIRKNVFDSIKSYHAGIVAQNGVIPSYCSIDGNLFLGFMTQNIAMTGGRFCKIVNNILNFKDLTNGNAYATFIDIEANSIEDVTEDLLIEGNEMDFRGTTLVGGDTQYAVGIFVQGVVTPGAKRVRVKNNTILSDYDGRMQAGVVCEGVTDVEVSGNTMAGAGVTVNIAQCNGARVFNNTELSPFGGSFIVIASGNSRFYNNLFRYPLATVTETERGVAASAVGTNILTMIQPIGDVNGRIYESFIGQTVTYNDTDYPVTGANTMLTNQTLTVTGTLPTLSQKTFLPGAVNTATDTINVPSHGLANYASAIYLGDSSLIGGLSYGQTLFIIRVDANNIKLATTRANAVAATAIDLTSAGTGTHYIQPALITKFSNNKYRDNEFQTYNLMGTSANNGSF